MSSIRKRQLEYFKNLNQKNFAGNKLSWNLIKPFFSDKRLIGENYTLIEYEKILDDD